MDLHGTRSRWKAPLRYRTASQLTPLESGHLSDGNPFLPANARQQAPNHASLSRWNQQEKVLQPPRFRLHRLKVQTRHRLVSPSTSPPTPSLARNLFARMAVQDPAARYTARQCLNHPFLAGEQANIPVALPDQIIYMDIQFKLMKVLLFHSPSSKKFINAIKFVNWVCE